VYDKNANELTRTAAGLGLVLIGAVFLLQQVYGTALPFLSWSYLWPFFVVVPGLVFFVAMLQGGRGAAGLAIPGSIVLTVGLILLYQNSTRHWQSWAYAWALIFPTAIGIGRAIQGWWGGRPDIARQGSAMAKAGVVLFLVAGVFFELVLNISGLMNQPMAQLILPGLLIVAGAFMLLRNGRPRARSTRWR